MEKQTSFYKVEAAIRNALLQFQESKSNLRQTFDNVPDRFAKKLRANYLGEKPTRAILSGLFHGSVDSQTRGKLLNLLQHKITNSQQGIRHRSKRANF